MEKRKAQRISFPLKIKYRLRGKKFFQEAITCDNISGKGIKLSVAQPLKINDKVNVAFSTEDNRKVFTALCRVAWREEIKKRDFKVGLEFIKIKEHLHFIEFLCEKMLDGRQI